MEKWIDLCKMEERTNGEQNHWKWMDLCKKKKNPDDEKNHWKWMDLCKMKERITKLQSLKVKESI